ncbi:hypothetical protein ACF0H5_002746 [Mactra antiquata]
MSQILPQQTYQGRNMSGVSHIEPRFRGISRRPNVAKKEEHRLQKLLDFIDNRMQDQRSKLRRQIETTQQTADEMEERRHKATLQVLKNYFEVTSGRARPQSQMNHIHEERMTGVLSEPSLATVPEVDPDVLTKPRSMYDRVTRALDTSRLPLINPKHQAHHQSISLPASIPNSNRSDESSTPRVINTPKVTPSSTPKNPSTPSDTTEENPWSEVVKPYPMKKDIDLNGVRNNKNNYTNEDRLPLVRNGHRMDNNDHINNYDQLNGHTYQKGILKPTSKMNLYIVDQEPPTPRLGDTVVSKRGISRHSSLKRSLKSNSSQSIVSMSELQPTRKQQAAHKLKNALGGSFRLQR